MKTTAYFCVPFIASILAVSWLLSMMLEHFSGHHHIFNKERITSGEVVKHSRNDSLRMTEKYENIFTFVQISDVHISKFRYVNEIIPQMKILCKDYLPLIQPKIVLVTGDITDAKAKDNLKSEQYLDEWTSYHGLVKFCRNHFNAVWLDVRGNHDDFGVRHRASSSNLYQRFGSASRYFANSTSFQYLLNQPFGRYAFNGIDMAPEPGPKRPFNFFGVVSQDDVKAISAMKENSRHYNMSFWFGHYPLSVITTPSKVRDKIQSGIAYLCGHLHTLGGLVPRMYGRPAEGHLELEAGDWKENRRYRIMAVDHDIFSFVDVRFPKMPVVLMTNPKDARFMVPDRESLQRIAKSTHIRFFVFSDVAVEGVIVSIDGRVLCEKARNVAGSFFVCPWNPEDYLVGLHEIAVNIKDSTNKESIFKSHFSLDGSMPLLDIVPAIIMLTNFCVVAKMIFFTTWIVIVIFPLSLRSGKMRRWNGLIIKTILGLVPHEMKSFATKDHLFWPLFYYNCYLAIGPLFIGELVPGSIGFCFVHGIYTNGHWIPGSLTYIYGTLQMTTFSFPMMLCLGDKQLFSGSNQEIRVFEKAKSTAWNLLKIFISILGFSFQVYFCRTLYICYGTISFILSPSTSWAIVFGIFLVYRQKYWKSKNKFSHA